MDSPNTISLLEIIMFSLHLGGLIMLGRLAQLGRRQKKGTDIQNDTPHRFRLTLAYKRNARCVQTRVLTHMCLLIISFWFLFLPESATIVSIVVRGLIALIGLNLCMASWKDLESEHAMAESLYNESL